MQTATISPPSSLTSPPVSQQQQQQQQPAQEFGGKNSIVDQGYSVYVSNILPSITPEYLQSVFSGFGPVDHIHIVSDKLTGQRKGIAFVHFKAIESQHAALAAGALEISGHVFEIRRTNSRTGNKSCVYIGGLAPNTTEQDIRLFVQAQLSCPGSSILNVDLKRNMDGSCKGFGFVEFVNETVAMGALASLSNQQFNGRVITCSWATFKKDAPVSRDRTAYIANLAQVTTEEMLRAAFSPYGVVGQVRQENEMKLITILTLIIITINVTYTQIIYLYK
eukprot:c19858_g1_i2.p1 GENE.c19858_g1_i2~~c19858_g1_i2.p1  ORF type:complete len:278 (+),score=58.66 c19858_g1_i2:100-933(+)